MNPVVKIVSGIITSINRLIDSLSLQTQETIKRAFFFLIFILAVTGIFIGYNMGVDSARIKSAPVAEYVNDTFRIDISRERNSGEFSGMLESEVMKDTEINSLRKISFPSRDNLDSDINRTLHENENPRSVKKTGPAAMTEDMPVEKTDNAARKDNKAVVRPLKKSSDKSGQEVIIINRDNDRKNAVPADKKAPSVQLLQKDRKTEPDALIRDKGIIKK